MGCVQGVNKKTKQFGLIEPSLCAALPQTHPAHIRRNTGLKAGTCQTAVDSKEAAPKSKGKPAAEAAVSGDSSDEAPAVNSEAKQLQRVLISMTLSA